MTTDVPDYAAAMGDYYDSDEKRLAFLLHAAMAQYGTTAHAAMAQYGANYQLPFQVEVAGRFIEDFVRLYDDLCERLDDDAVRKALMLAIFQVHEWQAEDKHTREIHGLPKRFDEAEPEPYNGMYKSETSTTD